MNRRRLLKMIAAIGVGTSVFHRALAAMAQDDQPISAEMIEQAEWIAGLELSPEERDAAAQGVGRLQQSVQKLRQISIEPSDSPAVFFRPLQADAETTNETHHRTPDLMESAVPRKPSNEDDIAFLPVSELSGLIRTRQITSTELTNIYLARLKKYNSLLNCVVTLTEDVALAQAARADQEIRAGRYRGPLHGIPWGAKDLISYPGFPTTWGAPQFQEQEFNVKATVAQRLENAGAVLVAKLSLGALAMGDKWFGGMTRSPWNPEVGSSGSSAGSASATVAGLVGFSLGSETLGSIVSPCRRCGATGLRPTFGRVSRYGCMPLSWTMDKIGPITRSVEDCALVLAAIHGTDGFDPTVVDREFSWPPRNDIRQLKVGYTEGRTPLEERGEIRVLRDLGVELVPIVLPTEYPARDVARVLDVEAATVFDELTRTNNTEGLNAWPGIFRNAQFMTAVDYLRAMRVRSRLMQAMEDAIENVDLYVNGNDLVITNLTGHPTAVMPFGYRDRAGVEVPFSVTFTGHLYGESDLLSMAHAVQTVQDAHLRRPPLDEHLRAAEERANQPDEDGCR